MKNMAYEIYAIDINEYSGKYVKEEIACAKTLGKEIFYYSDFVKKVGDI